MNNSALTLLLCLYLEKCFALLLVKTKRFRFEICNFFQSQVVHALYIVSLGTSVETKRTAVI